MEIFIGTSITNNYIKRARRFLTCLEAQPNNFCICYGFNPSIISKEYKINFFHLERKYPEISGMIQWGTWLRAIPHDDDDIYIISDADVEIQRPLNEEEIQNFSSYDDNTIGASMNATADDCLGYEAKRIYLSQGFHYKPQAKVVNCGVMVGRASVFKKITEKLEPLIPVFDKFSIHRSRCQFLICHVMNLLDIKIDVLGGEFHSNGHFGLPPNCRMAFSPEKVSGTLYCDEKLVMFKHHFRI